MGVFDLNMSFLEIGGFVFAVVGILLNSKKIIWCWPSYMAANIFWAFYFFPKGEWGFIALSTIYFCLNINGWYQWGKMKGGI